MGTLVNNPVVDFYRKKKRWVVFRQEPDPKNPGERKKIPYCVWDLLELLKHPESYPDAFEVARKGNPENWRTWGTLLQVNLCLQRWPQLLPAVMILASDGLILIDLDVHKTKDPMVLEQCHEVYEKCHSFTQQSVNGGLHVWIRASIPGNRDGEGLHIEMYNKHFATVTLYPAYFNGTWTDNHKLLEERQAVADWVYNLIFALRNGHRAQRVIPASIKIPATPVPEIRPVATTLELPAPQHTPVLDSPVDLDNDAALREGMKAAADTTNAETEFSDEEIISRASSSETFRLLFAGERKTPRKPDGSQRYPTASEADAALMAYVSLFTDSQEQVERIYSCSRLWDDVADRHPDFKSYIGRTAKFVLTGKQEHFPNYRFSRIETNFEEFLDKAAIQATHPSGISAPPESPNQSTFPLPNISAGDDGSIQWIRNSLVRECQKYLS